MSSIPAGAEVLILGLDPAGAECLRQLVQAGVKHFTVLNNDRLHAQDLSNNPWLSSASIGEPVATAIASWLSAYNDHLIVGARLADPLELLNSSSDFVHSFSLVITLHVGREVELAFGRVLFESPPRALIISRSDNFHAKMRSQYRIHRVTNETGNVVLEGIDLTLRPEPPLPEKCERARKALTAAVDVSSPDVTAALLVIYATGVVFKTTQGYPPAHRPEDVTLAGHESEVEEIIRSTVLERGLTNVVVDLEAIRKCCERGWSSLPLTSTMLGGLIAVEGVKLLSSLGRPVNTLPLDLAALATLGIPLHL